MSAITGAIGGAMGGFFGAEAQQGDKERAEKYADLAAQQFNYTTKAADQTGTQFDKMDPSSRNAMMEAMSAYDSKINAGGLDAVARQNLEGAKAEAAQTAAQSAAQVQSEAARRGGGNVGNKALLMQTIAGQQAGEGARRSAFDSAAMAENARNAALQGKVGTAGAVYGMDANRAAAQDAINQFNVRNAQQNISNAARRAEGEAGAREKQAGMFEGRAGGDVANFAGLGKMAGGALGAGLGAGGGSRWRGPVVQRR